MAFKDSVLNAYKLASTNRSLNDSQKADLLFDIVLKQIIKNKWSYYPEGTNFSVKELLQSKPGKSKSVNCFQLTELFISLCTSIGISNTDTVVYNNKPSSKLGMPLRNVNSDYHYTFTCFDKEFTAQDNQICFDRHSVVKVNNKLYDLVFSCAYENQDEPYDDTPFAKIISAIHSKNEDHALHLLRTAEGIDLEQTFSGDTLLHLAASNHFSRIVSFLLGRGVKTNTLSKLYGQVALAEIEDTDSELFELLARSTDPATVLQIRKNKNEIKFIEACGVILDQGPVKAFASIIRTLPIDFTVGGWTLLHHAAAANNKPLVAFLLENGANANIKNDEDQVPLYFATQKEVFALLAKKTDPVTVKDLKNDYDTTNYHAAYEVIDRNGSVAEFAQALQDTDVNFSNEDGQTLLHVVASRAHVGIADYLLKRGAEANSKEKLGLVPLQFVHTVGSPMYRLLESKTDNLDTIAPVQHSDSINTFYANVNMQIVGGFCTVVGTVAVCTALLVLDASARKMEGVVVAGVGMATILAGVGLFANGVAGHVAMHRAANADSEQANLLSFTSL